MLFYAIMVAVSSTLMGASIMLGMVSAREMTDTRKKLKSGNYTEESKKMLKYSYDSDKMVVISMTLNVIACLLIACNFIIKLNI